MPRHARGYRPLSPAPTGNLRRRPYHLIIGTDPPAPSSHGEGLEDAQRPNGAVGSGDGPDHRARQNGTTPPPDSASPFASSVERPAVSEGLRHLFPQAAPDTEHSDRPQSSHFDSFLGELPARIPPLPTGSPALDTLLSGGLRPGLWLIHSDRASASTSFLDGLVWAAVDAGRTATLFSLRTGTQAAWERFVCAFGQRMGEPVDLAEMRSPRVSEQTVARIRKLDADMMERLFPVLDLEDSLPGESRSLVGFLTHLEGLLNSPRQVDFMAVDALPQLAILVGLSTGRSVALFTEADDLLRRNGAVGVIASDSRPDAPLVAAVSGVLELVADGLGPDEDGFGAPADAGSTEGAGPGVSVAEGRVSLLTSRWEDSSGPTPF